MCIRDRRTISVSSLFQSLSGITSPDMFFLTPALFFCTFSFRLRRFSPRFRSFSAEHRAAVSFLQNLVLYLAPEIVAAETYDFRLASRDTDGNLFYIVSGLSLIHI